MPRQRKDSATARLTPFAKQALDDLVDKLSTTPPVLPVDDWEVVGGLIFAAQRSPTEAIKAVIGTYRDKELEVAAVEAVAGFLRAYSV